MQCEKLEGRTLLSGAGDFDTTFGQRGIVYPDFGPTTYLADLKLQADGKIVVAGAIGVDGDANEHADFFVARFNSDGSLDKTFGNQGKVRTDFSGGSDQAHSMAIQPDGKIVVAGECRADFAIARYTPDGKLDTTFASNGKKIVAMGGRDEADCIAVYKNGKIVVAGSAYFDSDHQYRMAVLRLTKSGALDKTFDTDGKRTIGFGALIASSVALTSDGSILLAGIGGQITQYQGYSSGAMVKLKPNGAIDSTFGGGDAGLYDPETYTNLQPTPGVMLTTQGTEHGSFESIAIAPNGQIHFIGTFYESGIYVDGVYDADGSHGAANTVFDGQSSSHGIGLALADNGDVIEVGDCQKSYGSDISGRNMVVRRFSGDEDRLFQDELDFAGDDGGFRVSIASDQSVVILGYSYRPNSDQSVPLIVRLDGSNRPADMPYSTDSDGTLTINGTDGDDRIVVEEDHFIFNGQIYSPTFFHVSINGGAGDDFILTDQDATVHGGAGRDRIIGSQYGDLLFGDGGNDTIHGMEGDDTLDGAKGHDRLIGDDGDDLLRSRDAVVDRLYGGNGTDSAKSDHSSLVSDVLMEVEKLV